MNDCKEKTVLWAALVCGLCTMITMIGGCAIGLKSAGIRSSNSNLQTPHLVTMQSAAQPASTLDPRPSVSIAPPSVSLIWNAVSNVVGYNVYVGFAHNSYERQVPVDTTEAEITGLNYGIKYHFAVTSIDTNGLESDFSNDYPADVQTVLNLTFPQPGSALESSRDLMSWSPHAAHFTNGVWRVRINPAVTQEFYRTVQPFTNN
jgi:hypothetical protein